MLKTLAQLEHKIGENAYHFLCAANAPIHEIKDAILQFLGHVVSIENAVKAQKEATAAAPEAPVEAKPEG